MIRKGKTATKDEPAPPAAVGFVFLTQSDSRESSEEEVQLYSNAILLAGCLGDIVENRIKG